MDAKETTHLRPFWGGPFAHFGTSQTRSGGCGFISLHLLRDLVGKAAGVSVTSVQARGSNRLQGVPRGGVTLPRWIFSVETGGHDYFLFA